MKIIERIAYLLNVHEGLAGFKWRHNKNDAEPLCENMIITRKCAR